MKSLDNLCLIRAGWS
uniref:Uncharacterized protein n=1 Tax=Arundo donax TaxID=35708 RepID=A0A0A9F121_ARUDO